MIEEIKVTSEQKHKKIKNIVISTKCCNFVSSAAADASHIPTKPQTKRHDDKDRTTDPASVA